MSYSHPFLLADLRSLLTETGSNGGLVGPSIYDTAQVVRCMPPKDVGPVVEWLLDQQHSDGGWGTPEVPRARDLPTLATILALRSVAPQRARSAIAAGIRFLRSQAACWHGQLPEDIPVGLELLLPTLIEEANRMELLIDPQPYAELIRLGQKRRRMISGRHFPAGTTPLHSWEALGFAPDSAVIDGSGGVGHSPAATAAWLAATTGRADLANQRVAAARFLEQAGCATGCGIAGVMPTVWPITNFERVWVLYTLQLGGLLGWNELHHLVEPQIELVSQSMRCTGLGMSEWFTSDGDITATTMAMLAGSGRRPDLAMLQQFAQPDGGGYTTYFGELQHSLSATAHAAHALALLNSDARPPLQLLLQQRSTDGTWSGDKWHSSWLYLTSHTIAAYCAAGRADLARESLPALCNARQPDGSWGANGSALEDTAYAVLALLALDRAQALAADDYMMLEQAEYWMWQYYPLLVQHSQPRWVGKELYRPQRVVRATILSAMLGVAKAIDHQLIA
jgi:hypothetical protein